MKFLQKPYGLNSSIHSYNITVNENYTKNVLDTFAIMQGEKEFYPKIWDALYKCMKADNETDILSVSNKGWEGLLAYGQANISSDPWGVHFKWHENNITKLPQGLLPDVDKVVIQEPCGTVSNLAFLRTFLTLCGHSKWSIPIKYYIAAKNTFVLETILSAFFHASGTELGQLFDQIGENIFSWSMHQASISSLPYDPILFDLQPTPLSENSLTMTTALEHMILTESVFNWKTISSKFTIPEIYRNVGAILGTVATLALNKAGSDFLMNSLGKLLLTPEDLDFFINSYLPTLRNTFEKESIKPCILTRIILIKKFIGVILKLLYGVVYQEVVLPSAFFINPIVTKLGNMLMPFINQITNFISGYGHYRDIYDLLQQYSINIYPGRSNCGGKRYSHFIWHEQMGNGLVDLFYLADDIHKVIKGQSLV